MSLKIRKNKFSIFITLLLILALLTGLTAGYFSTHGITENGKFEYDLLKSLNPVYGDIDNDGLDGSIFDVNFYEDLAMSSKIDEKSLSKPQRSSTYQNHFYLQKHQ